MPISQQQISDWRNLIAQQDRLEDVVESLSQAIDKNDVPWLASWRNPAISLRSEFASNEQLKISGERSQADYNAARAKLRARTLSMLDELADKRTFKQKSNVQNAGASAPAWLKFGLPLVAILVLGYFFWPTSPDPVEDDEVEVEAELCPDFEASSRFKAMVLPYNAPAENQRNTNLHNRVSGILQNFAEDYEVNIDSRAVNLDVDGITLQTGYPGGPADADRIGLACSAQLVIWGYTERTSDNENLTVTEYRFVESPAWQFSEYQLDENMQVASAPTFTEIVSSGQLTTGIEEALRLIFGLVARDQQNNSATIALLNNHPISPEDAQSYQLQQLALAEAYHHEDLDKEAEQAYSDLIAEDSTNLIALRNRGALRYDMEEYADAAADMSTVLAHKPDDEQARYTRALSNLQANKLLEAEVDLNRLSNQSQVATPDSDNRTSENGEQETNPPAEVPTYKINTEQMRVLSSEWDASRDQTRGIRDAGREALQNNSTDVGQLKAGMHAAYQLHDFRLANRLAERVSVLEPDDAEAYQVAADAYLQRGQEEEANRVIEKASDRGLQDRVILHRAIMARPLIQTQTRPNLIEAERVGDNR
ncbi:MAG: hypothetical protein AAGF87_00890 [Bacteroidota bacterium]